MIFRCSFLKNGEPEAENLKRSTYNVKRKRRGYFLNLAATISSLPAWPQE
jgi:hypothetical protein